MRRIRHQDGIKDSLMKLKNLIQKFKKLPRGKKIAIVLSNIVATVVGIMSAKSLGPKMLGIKKIQKLKTISNKMLHEVKGNGTFENPDVFIKKRHSTKKPKVEEDWTNYSGQQSQSPSDPFVYENLSKETQEVLKDIQQKLLDKNYVWDI